MSTSYDENAEHELSQEDARDAASVLRAVNAGAKRQTGRTPFAPTDAIDRVIAALEAFAAGSTNIVPEE